VTRAPSTGPPAVLKFGGTALEHPAAIARWLRSVLAGTARAVIVVSARAGVTDLLERASTGRVGPAELRRSLRARHPGLRRVVTVDLERVGHRPERSSAGPATRPFPDREELLALGERLAVQWLAGELGDRGVPARPLLADRAGLRVRGRGAHRWIDLDASAGPVVRAFEGAWSRGQVPLITGFFGRDSRGRPRTLGRGSSDYTAVAIAAIVGAHEVRLVKREGPIRSADPRHVPDARLVPVLTYEQAEEVARLGSRILHPLAVELARERGIEVNVLDLMHPGRSTRIARDARGSGHGPMLSLQEGLTLWQAPRGLGEAGWWGQLSEQLERRRAELVLVGAARGRRSAILRPLPGPAPAPLDLAGALEDRGEVVDVSLVTVQGNGHPRSELLPRLRGRAGVLGTWSDDRSIVAAVRPELAPSLVRELHRAVVPAAPRASQRLSGRASVGRSRR
jgi:aspartokinase